MRPLRIAIISDAWHPQVNGVVRTLDTTAHHLARTGHTVRLITPAEFRTVPCPTYAEIRLALRPRPRMGVLLDDFAPDAVHIATEGPLGHAARACLLTRGMRFTTSYHTRFPEYLRLRLPLPLACSYAYLRRFHGAAARTLVATESMRRSLSERGFAGLEIWARGVDTAIFNPDEPVVYGLPRPIHLYMGRVAVEKNITAFLDLPLAGSKVVIGSGPDLDKLRRSYPAAHFLGAKFGRDLARHLAGSDVFVFPSRTDTFGLVLLEALACGLPVAAYPVPGPLDIVVDGQCGALDEDLGRAIARALPIHRRECIAHARKFSWQKCTAVFAAALAVNRCAAPIGKASAA